ncbi:hypothetical protein GALL_412920 [mine drainage metagenome]|uniref:Uncharacterized protein n=1 Tax=mine drainage metagenome TaxID=410659 RepID=A0A1J5Q018_9ZZZZ
MDIRHAVIDRIQQYLLQITDYRGIIDVRRLGFIGLGFGNSFIIGKVEIKVFGIQAGQSVIFAFTDLGNQFAELVIFDNDNIDGLIGLKLDFINSLEIGRIGDGYR